MRTLRIPERVRNRRPLFYAWAVELECGHLQSCAWAHEGMIGLNLICEACLESEGTVGAARMVVDVRRAYVDR